MMDERGQWWKRFLRRIHFPENGHFMIVPGGDDPELLWLLHGETMAKVQIDRKLGDTLEEIAGFFREILPGCEVAAPVATGGEG